MANAKLSKTSRRAAAFTWVLVGIAACAPAPIIDVNETYPREYTLRASADSELPHPFHWYSAASLVDRNPNSWCEGVPGPGIGQAFTIEFHSRRESALFEFDHFHIKNGFGVQPAFARNNRIKALRMHPDQGEPIRLTIRDVRKNQKIALPRKVRARKVRFEITEIYRGYNPKDTCVAEISFSPPEPPGDRTRIPRPFKPVSDLSGIIRDSHFKITYGDPLGTRKSQMFTMEMKIKNGRYEYISISKKSPGDCNITWKAEHGKILGNMKLILSRAHGRISRCDVPRALRDARRRRPPERKPFYRKFRIYEAGFRPTCELVKSWDEDWAPALGIEAACLTRAKGNKRVFLFDDPDGRGIDSIMLFKLQADGSISSQ